MPDTRRTRTKTITIDQPQLCTRLSIWSPRYHDKHEALGEPVVLLSKAKVYHASPTILVEFTQAKHLLGQRFAITRNDAQKYPEDSNGKIACLAVPLSAFSHWLSKTEERNQVRQAIESFGW